jgi:hypothetical protein
MKELRKTYERSAKILAAALLLLLIAGSFADLPISKALYPGQESSLGQFFAAFGALPAFLNLTSAGLLLLENRRRLPGPRPLVWAAAGTFLVVLGLLLCVRGAAVSVPAMPSWVALLTAVFLAAVTGASLLVLTAETPVRTIFRFVLTLVFVSLASMLLMQILALPWGRARMRLIAQTGNDTYFTPWWRMGRALEAKLVADGVKADEFRSFPSYRTGCAACAMLTVLLPTLYKNWQGKERACLLVGAGWTAVVAFSNLRMGADFLSDSAFSWLLTLGVMVLGVRLFYFDKRVFGGIWALLERKKQESSAT